MEIPYNHIKIWGLRIVSKLRKWKLEKKSLILKKIFWIVVITLKKWIIYQNA